MLVIILVILRPQHRAGTYQTDQEESKRDYCRISIIIISCIVCIIIIIIIVIIVIVIIVFVIIISSSSIISIIIIRTPWEAMRVCQVFDASGRNTRHHGTHAGNPHPQLSGEKPCAGQSAVG